MGDQVSFNGLKFAFKLILVRIVWKSLWKSVPRVAHVWNIVSTRGPRMEYCFHAWSTYGILFPRVVHVWNIISTRNSTYGSQFHAWPTCGITRGHAWFHTWATRDFCVAGRLVRVDGSSLYLWSSVDPIKTADVWHVWIFRGEENKKLWSSTSAKVAKCR